MEATPNSRHTREPQAVKDHVLVPRERIHGPSAGRRIVAISVAPARPLRVHEGRMVPSGIGKRPVRGPVAVRRLGLAGDEQADLSVHGGLQKAVYAYPSEHLRFWCEQRRAHGIAPAEAALQPGFVGENLLLTGLLARQLWVGDLLRFAGSDCVLRVTAPRQPCYKLGVVMGFAEAGRVMVREGICGFYLAVDAPGTLAAGLAIEVVPGARSLSLVEAMRAKWARYRND